MSWEPTYSPQRTTVHIRARDYNRNKHIHFYEYASIASNFRFMFLGQQPKYMRFVKAQIISYHDLKSAKLYSNGILLTKDPKKPVFHQNNVILSPGNTSYWNIAHWTEDTSININKPPKVFLDNLLLMVEANPKTRKPMKLSDTFRQQCSENEKQYPMELKLRFNYLKGVLSNHIKQISENKNMDMFNLDNMVFEYKYQLRYTDEDLNKHINQSTYIKMIEDVLFEYNVSLRNNKMIIYSISSMYMKEVKRSDTNYAHIKIYKQCKVNEKDRNNDSLIGFDLYGFIECDNQKCNGFIARIVNNLTTAKL